MLKIGIDWDDTLCRFIYYACEIANEKYKTSYTVRDITQWGFSGSPAIEIVSQFYNSEEVYKRQQISEIAKNFVNNLRKKYDVYIVTAVPPEFMGIRAKQIKEAFPDLPDRNIILGSGKDMVSLDVLLDDGPHNILKSTARYAVLMRQPWNSHLSGVLSVNDYEEFMELLEQIKRSIIEDKVHPTVPSVIALVGPSGSNKNTIAKLLSNDGFAAQLKSYTTGNADDSHIKISAEEFLQRHFISKAVYAGDSYGICMDDITTLSSKNMVVAVDICGAIALKRIFPTVIVFCKNSRENIIESILEKDIPNGKKKIRLLSLENELRNENLCDFSVRSDNPTKAVEEIKALFD